MWILRTPSDSENGTYTFRLSPGAVKTMGRAVRADFVVDVAMVSRLHCRLTAAESTLEVLDLGSTNGTFVNGSRVDRARLSPGDRLKVGRLELEVGKAKTENAS